MSVQALPTNKPSIRFGCRMVAYVPAETPRDNQDEFIRQCLIDNENSLKKQSTRPPGAKGSTVRSWESVSTMPVSTDGWGLATFVKDRIGPWVRKAGTHAARDSEYDTSVEEAIRQKPDVLLAHIRQGLNPRMENAHPFKHEKWAFMHNGQVEAVLDPAIRVPAQQFKPSAGTTDTEIAFHYFLSELQNRFGTIDASRIPKAELADTFGKVTRELVDTSRRISAGRVDPVNVDKLQAPGVHISADSRFRVSPAANFIASDGNILMASCFSRKLFLGLAPTGKGDTDVLITSEPIQPKGATQIQWTELPDNHMLFLERNAGQIDIQFLPF